jgi:hypothetical protein
VRREHAEHTYTINTDHSVQQAVWATYPAFPLSCSRVLITRGPRLLWDPTWAGFLTHTYDTIREGDVVEIQVRGYVFGPDRVYPPYTVVVENENEYSDPGLLAADPLAPNNLTVSALPSIH